MRTIKFRAIDEFSDQFIYGQAFFVDSDNGQGYLSDGIDRHQLVKKETVGQFTGLTDKTGKDIYEGDIVKRIYKYEVAWKNGGFYLRQKNKYHLTITNLGADFEIIGNIHENPELL